MDPASIVSTLKLWKQSEPFPFPRQVVADLFTVTKDTFMSQPVLLELCAPKVICGDVFGCIEDVCRLFDTAGWPPTRSYLFLGNYINRGRHGLITLCLLFALKVQYPDNFFLLRGNHECGSISRIYGFYDEMKRLFDVKLWKRAIEVFNCMPVCALIQHTIFCTHGGLSPEFSFDEIRKIQRPTDVPDHGLMCDLLWSDPDPSIEGWGLNDRGVSYVFGIDIIDAFCSANDIELIVRSHQYEEKGYRLLAQDKFASIFGSSNHRGILGNPSASLVIDEMLTCSFITLPAKK
eukprot:PhF_6_TR33856/c0_g1_i4/m.49665/K06269/PPP1C; serine/threonine-protein phosphatase PP1 catalytic subunit